jgi:DNA-binding NtrC family response regulator
MCVLAATARDLEAETRRPFPETRYASMSSRSSCRPRERREDIALARPCRAPGDALARLLSGDGRWVAPEQKWPGNVRELENAIERAAVLSNRERLDTADFADAPRTTHHAPGGTLGEAVEAAERQAITAALAAVNGNRREAAKNLGVSLRTLFYKIERYGIS